jgi:hypothetical protein
MASQMTCRFPHEICAEGSVGSTCIACYARDTAERNETELIPHDEIDAREPATNSRASQAVPALVDYLLDEILVDRRFRSFPSARLGTSQPGSGQNQEP